MNMNATSMQNYWFPGSANQRSIFNFTNGVLDIESPGFPLVPEDSDNFGNVITLPDAVGYYIIGKYLVDSAFTTVAGSTGIFDALTPTVANCMFAPDIYEKNAAHLYYIDNNGLHYGHITRDLVQRSSLDTLLKVTLTLPPIANSPLCILGHPSGEGNWLFYINKQDDSLKLVVVYCLGSDEISSYSLTLSGSGMPVSIDAYKNRIALVCDDASLVYGVLTAKDSAMTIAVSGRIDGLSPDCIQSAFSAEGNSLFWLTKEPDGCYVNYRNMTTGTVTSTLTSGNYAAMKCGPDNIIYGLSCKTRSASTLLTVTPKNVSDDFSVSEIFASANGGYFPATGWNLYSV
ncbi:hypothetical protein [Pseudescherichia sp.]|uniref:hypothetical protein n=1 Tax=Pseudescherichia sp. TaxID=2055881 RepID=UPI00289691C1|nr:hypothetical protein [Pseudescherichia sp.]